MDASRRLGKKEIKETRPVLVLGGALTYQLILLILSRGRSDFFQKAPGQRAGSGQVGARRPPGPACRAGLQADLRCDAVIVEARSLLFRSRSVKVTDVSACKTVVHELLGKDVNTFM
jgi:hypothetical protein